MKDVFLHLLMLIQMLLKQPWLDEISLAWLKNGFVTLHGFMQRGRSPKKAKPSKSIGRGFIRTEKAIQRIKLSYSKLSHW